MENTTPTITVSVLVQAPLNKVWDYWTLPEHITKWNFASDDWTCPWAKNDPRTGGHFSARMEAKDGSMGFDFEGIYDEVIPQQRISYSMGDDRKVWIQFEVKEGNTLVTETFIPEQTHSLEMQQGGWQAILNNFKTYTENN